MTGRRTHTTIASPLGVLTLVATDGVLSGLFMDARNRHFPDPRELGRAEADGFAAVIGQLDEYFAGKRTRFDVPLALFGTRFQVSVWRQLLEVPYGATLTYTQLAARLGRGANAARAIGGANGSNPVSIIVPCHRVVGAGGALTGYAWGVERKRWLLDREAGGVLF